MNSDVLSFWNSRAKLSDKAGSNDLIAKSLEIEALAEYFKDGFDVMEFGCGNGVTALEMARRFNIRVEAYDFSPVMIESAIKLADSTTLSSRVHFSVGDIANPPEISRRFDLVFTERMVINLPHWSSQLAAIKTLCSYLKYGGKLLLMENSSTGLGKLNDLRKMVGLAEIAAPWHNVYLDDSKVSGVSIDGCKLVDVVPYSATYYFLSRVVNAWLAHQEGHEPSYDAPVNRLAQLLPPMGDHAQGKIWVFEKRT